MRGHRSKFMIAGVLALSLVGAACSNDDAVVVVERPVAGRPVPAASAPHRIR